MVKEYPEGLYDALPEEFSPEHLGQIFEEGKALGISRGQWIVGSAVGAIILIIAGVAYVTYAPEEEVILGAKEYHTIIKQRKAVDEVLSDQNASVRQLRAAVDQAIDIATSRIVPIVYNEKQAYPEKYVAIINALEGLLYLDLGGLIDFNKSADKTWFEEKLEQIGAIRVEYFHDGIKNFAPLMETAWYRKELRDEMGKGTYANKSTIYELKDKIQSYSAQESFTIVAPALVLGEWFRYYNDMANAQRCFQIGRMYVEGYSRADYAFPGKRPAALNALWNEYVSCLENLAEIAFDQKNYRQARSYLTRAFNTPSSEVQLAVSENVNEQLKEVNTQLVNVDQDIKVLKQAIESPEQLSSFPLFHEDDQNINWNALLDHLAAASEGSEKAPLNRVWVELSPSVQRKILREAGALRLSEEVKIEVSKAFNKHIQAPDFYRYVVFEPMALSVRGKQLYKKSQIGTLNIEEEQFLNREVMESALTGAISNDFVLSDGTRIGSNLNSKEYSILLKLYESELQSPGISSEKKEDIKTLLQAIQSGEKRPKLSDLKGILVEKINIWQEQANQYEQAFDEERAKLKGIDAQVDELGKEDIVDVVRIRQLSTQAELAKSRQLESVVRRKEALQHVEELSRQLDEVSEGLRQKLADFEAVRAIAVQKQNKLRSKSLREQEPLLKQLDKQIALREKYLRLLTELKNSQGDLTLQRLQEEVKALQKEEDEVHSVMAQQSGDDREKTLLSLALLEDKKQRIIVEIDSLFNPIRTVIAEIAEEDKKMIESQKLLQEIQKEIGQLAGSPTEPGEIEQKTRKRAELLLAQTTQVLQDPRIDEEVEKLNREISQDHARLSGLLQTEESVIASLETFYPTSIAKETVLQPGKLDALKNYLQEQSALMKEYGNLRRESDLYKEMRLQEEIILENLQLIAKSTEENTQLTENQINELTRYMRTIIEAKAKLRRAQALAGNLGDKSYLRQQLATISAQGIQLNIIDMYQMEYELGLDVQVYRKVFDERNTLVRKLEEVLVEKDLLNKQQRQAAVNHDQVQVDLLIPKIASVEGAVAELSGKIAQVNSELRAYSEQYAEKLHNIQKFREKIAPQVISLQKHTQEVQKKMEEKTGKLGEVIEGLFGVAEHLRRSIVELDLGDLGSLDGIIESQEEELNRLIKVRQLKRTENYYKAKALWMIGKSFYEQSRLGSYDELTSAHKISKEMLEDEARNGKQIFDEFDETYIYSDAMFGNVSEQDQQRANFEYWTEFLENNALRVFHSELPKYSIGDVGSGKTGDILSEKQKANLQVYLLRGKFLSGKIYFQKAQRYFNNSANNGAVSIQENAQVLNALEQARTAFVGFLDFASSVTYGGTSQFTEEKMGSQEFPKRMRHIVRLEDNAKMYLGVIATLKGEYERAISYYRDLLGALTKESGASITMQEAGEGLPIGQEDPLVVQDYAYQAALHPYYASLLSLSPLAHEALYRLARNYEYFAEEEEQKLISSIHLTAKQKEEIAKRYEQYATRGIAYYTQLVLTQAYSSFRPAAIFHRALLRKGLNDADGAKNDLLSLLNASEQEGRAEMEVFGIGAQGELMSVEPISKVEIALELGKIYFDQGEYDAALKTFMLAQEYGGSSEKIIESKVSYAKSLIASKKWLEADLFISQLLKEAESVPEEYKIFYPHDLRIDLASTKKAFGRYQEALFLVKEMFKIAPYALQKGGDLDLSDGRGMLSLESDYRDAIRPLGLACLESADLLMRLQKLEEAQVYYRKAEKLFQLLPWKEDALMRHKERTAYQNYKNEQLLKARWGHLKADIHKLRASSLEEFRKTVRSAREAKKTIQPAQIVADADAALKHINDEKAAAEALLQKLSTFYENETKKLPEEKEKERLEKQRILDSSLGLQKAQRYQALSHIADNIAKMQDMSLEAFFPLLTQSFTKNSLEYQLINAFVALHVPELQLQEEDRDRMLPMNDNLENVLLINDFQNKMKNFPEALLSWVQQNMRATGLDTQYIPVSPQAKILEEINLYRASLFAQLDIGKHYTSLITMAEDYLKAQQETPNRIVDEEVVWQIEELAAISAETREDWKLVERFNRYLITTGGGKYFVQPDGSDRMRAELALATALVNLSQKAFGEIAFLTNREEQDAVEKHAISLQQEAKSLLDKLMNISGSDAVAVATRIRAGDLLQQI